MFFLFVKTRGRHGCGGRVGEAFCVATARELRRDRHVANSCRRGRRRAPPQMLDLEVQKLIQDGKFRCWLDIDINDTRAAYQRAVDFVGAKNLAYNLSSVRMVAVHNPSQISLAAISS